MLRNTILLTAFMPFALPLFAQLPNTSPWPASGNVGIGTTTPQSALDVHGVISTYSMQIASPSNDNVLSSIHGTNSYNLIGTYAGWDQYAVYIAGYNAPISTASGVTTATQRVYIGNPTFSNNYLSVNFVTGGVGIGTNNTNDPNNRLFVETGIRTRKVTVDLATWPDYVFAAGYPLLPLDSLNRFIAANHYLPGMPSADSVAKNGLELGDSQAKLLKKVEELTLYVLQLKQELEEVKAENRRSAQETAARHDQ